MARTSTVNPFVFSRAVAPSEAIARRGEVDDLLGKASGGHNVVLYGPRRTGKTSLLRQLSDAAPRRKLHVVTVDLSDVLSVTDVAVRLQESLRALPGAARRIIGRELGSLGITTPLGGVTAGRRPPEMEPLATVHSLLEVPATIAEQTGRRVILVLDEFQALTNLTGVDGVFRSHLQHQDRVSCIFCGSEPSMLRALFERRARPLYGQALMLAIPPLDFRATHDFMTDRFLETGKDCLEVAPTLLELSELHPQRLMLLGYTLWEGTGRRPATLSDLRLAYDAAIRAVDPELRTLWEGLSANEQRVLVAVASGLTPYQAEAQALTGMKGASSVQKPVETLVNRSILARREAGDLVVVDPLLGRWARRNGGARRQVFVVPRPKGGFVVTDGPSLAFVRSEHATLDEAEHAASRVAGEGAGAADVMVYDDENPNDLPAWAAGVPLSKWG